MTIEKRLGKLELELARAQFFNRLLVVLGIGVLLVICFFASGTPTAQENAEFVEIEAKAFVLKDDNGLNRAILTMIGDCPVLYMFDEIGTALVELSACENTPYLGLFDKNVKLLWSAP